MDIRQSGLSTQEVNERIARGQINKIEDHISKTNKQIVMEHVLTYFNFLNVFLAIVVLSTGRWKNITFLGVVITNTVIGIYQELKVKKIIDQLAVVTVSKVKVLRNQKEIDIPVEYLVIDDILHIQTGEQIGTDCQVLKTMGLEVNESLLTGESNPIVKKENDELLAGSFVVAGSAYAKVIRVGQHNYATQLVVKAKKKNNASSEMKDTIEKVIKILSVIIIPVGSVLFLSQMSVNPYDRATAIVKTVAGIVGMIPEGLVLLTSLSFILGVGKLAKKKALIQEMEAIEALARVDILCLDKTGTLTTGELEVVDVQVMDDICIEEVKRVMGVIAYCSEENNVTQKALQNYFPKQEAQIDDYIPFSSQRKKQTVTIHNEGIYVLGAPEYVLEEKNQYEKQISDALQQGLRVIVLTKQNEKKVLAFIMIQDCMREDAKETILFFNESQVDVCILSGDHPQTVSKIAKNAGLKHADKYIDATLLPSDEEELRKIVKHYRIFGRVSPEQKQSIIHCFQYDHHVVGMVGDGVNDVLALKDADCGIAMASGSDAARKAAHIVLMDSCFGSMKNIVLEGRRIIADIERVSSLYLTKTIYSTFLCLIYALFRLSYPFTPLQLSLISSLAIGIPSFILTMDRSSQLSAQGFFKHIMSIAVPCASTMIVYMIMISFIGYTYHFDACLMSSYHIVVAGFISFLVVFIVCIPLNKLRTALLVSVSTLFFLILFVFHDFFGIYALISPQMKWSVLLCLSSLFVLSFFTRLFAGIYKKINNYK